ncbi:MAG: xanthine phosphoribosyltransferase [Acidimicrobiia bacterium]|nr:xanthine phosphoribosyltransferase [Acidimicrobiia bacterium]
MDQTAAAGTMRVVDLRTAIDSMATVEGTILKVDRFLNHRVDPSLMAQVGRQIAALLGPHEPDLLLTAEASGIPPALAAGIEMGVPIVYAKKYLGPGNRYTFSREVVSATKGTEYRVEVARHVLQPGLRLSVVDDFLAGGRTAEALGEIAEEAGCTVLGATFVIEKTFADGRARLEAHGWPVWSLVQVESLANGEVRFAR